mmetsp:Transcript_14254/g.38910  ORF Transcript_14254/g.38910 Transcript_14254/m.38910 type:complete len:394 (-) Transcript_14254:20-1201(-)
MTRFHTPFVVLLFAFTVPSNGLLKPDKEVYTIGGWNGGTIDLFKTQYKKVFESYLSQEVGTLYDPPIKFQLTPVDFEINATATSLIKQNMLDFVFHSPGGVTCLEAMFDFQPIVTQRQLVSGKEAGVFGSLIYSLLSNPKITTLEDLRGKRVAVGQPLASGSYQQGWNYLNKKGINIFVDSSQIIFYQSDYARQLSDVLSGAVDYAMVKSSWLESNAPNDMAKLRFHNLANLSFQGEPYQFLTTSQLVPNSGLTAHPSIPKLLRSQVFAALMNLNRTNPAAKAAKLAGFTFAYSYESVRSMEEQLGIIQTTSSGKICLDQFAGLYQLLSCPSGYYKVDEDQLATACDQAGLPCPSGLTCFCRPCRVDEHINPVWFWVVLGVCVVVGYISFGSG